MKIIVPCCGRSSRFPNQAPKWMLPSHDGRPMIAHAVSGLGKINDIAKNLIVAILREHEEKYHVVDGLTQVFGSEITIVIHDEPTRSQSETVALTLKKADVKEPFLVKDSDNVFVVDPSEQEQPHNYVCADSLNHYDAINPRNKSYLQVDHQNRVVNIREKVVISDLFNVGGYYFTDPVQFIAYYEKLAEHITAWQREIYISDVIGAMILDGIPFYARPITGYQDWGTIHEWKKALQERKAYFISLDGFLFERGSLYFYPKYEDVKANIDAINAVKALQKQGHTLFYLSIRPNTGAHGASMSALTEKQLAEAGISGPYHVIYNCPVAKYNVVTAPHPSMPMQTSGALEVSPQDESLLEKLLGER